MKNNPPPLLGALSSGGSLDPDPVSRDFTPVQTGDSNVSFVLSGAELTTSTAIPPNGEIARTLSFIRRIEGDAGLVLNSVPEVANLVPTAVALLILVTLVALRGRSRARA